ncbi:dienelactone hydrolase family protein [Halodesulfovibrio sp.]|jgi:dienelactone hydrolase|uniref:dienelactone hydrolase family protein n=1 Tax=Halodesulfovibrio sp. TaxID=1912772 RepID=UPI0025F8B117|nr:dienelactone hydrolase family protein [Halodesulfovibrio sp.]MCT4536422.1 dienelactone hydrolase family protein [Halodesulfovibrio sp.]
MHIIIATDIWGKTPHLNAMAASFEEIASKVTIVDPYDGGDPEFASKDAAYAHYKEQCGDAAYVERVSQAVAEATESVCLLGFSAGAGAVWSAVSGSSVGTVKAAVCFYSSSIHTMTDYLPKVPVEFVFAKEEPHYDVENVARTLQDIENVQSYITPFEHGFLNPASAQYDSEVYFFWLQWIKDQLGLHCPA